MREVRRLAVELDRLFLLRTRDWIVLIIILLFTELRFGRKSLRDNLKSLHQSPTDPLHRARRRRLLSLRSYRHKANDDLI